MDYNFPQIMDETHVWEGGYVNHPDDPGGSTNMGITQGTLNAERKHDPSLPPDVRNLTVNQAGSIYMRSYWKKVRGPDLPSGLDHVAFDGAVNSGPKRGARWLQTGVGVTADGIIGNRTVARAKALSQGERGIAITKACDARRGFLRGLRIFSTFGKGWMRRVNGVEAHAHKLANTSAQEAAVAEKRSVKEANTGAVGTGAGVGGGVVSYDTIAANLPTYAIVAAGIVLLLFVANQFGRARNDRQRADLIRKANTS